MCGMSMRLGVHGAFAGSCCGKSTCSAAPAAAMVDQLAALLGPSAAATGLQHSFTAAPQIGDPPAKVTIGRGDTIRRAEAMVEQVVRRRGGTGARTGGGGGAAVDRSDVVSDAGGQAELPNPLTLQAVSSVFRRRWAMPMTIAVLCLAAHTFGLFDDANTPAGDRAEAFDFREKLSRPLQYSKYGVAGGAVFGCLMWVLVVSLSDKAEGKSTGPNEHWAQNDTMLGAVLLSMGMATGGICTFAATAVWDITRQNLMQPPLPGG